MLPFTNKEVGRTTTPHLDGEKSYVHKSMTKQDRFPKYKYTIVFFNIRPYMKFLAIKYTHKSKNNPIKREMWPTTSPICRYVRGGYFREKDTFLHA